MPLPRPTAQVVYRLSVISLVLMIVGGLGWIGWKVSIARRLAGVLLRDDPDPYSVEVKPLLWTWKDPHFGDQPLIVWPGQFVAFDSSYHSDGELSLIAHATEVERLWGRPAELARLLKSCRSVRDLSVTPTAAICDR